MANNTSPLMSALLTCLCEQLITDGHPVCECCMVVSEEIPPARGCDCVCEDGQGVGWIRFVSAAWQQDVAARCLNGFWRVSFQLGVYRCVSSEPTCATDAAAALAAAEDLASLGRAAQCCTALAQFRHTLGGAEVIGPLGACVGVALDVVVDMPAL